MEKTYKSLLIGILVITVLSIVTISASDSNYLNLTLPANGSTVSGTVTFNVTNHSLGNPLHCDLYIGQSAITANTSWYLINNVSNVSAIDFYINNSNDTTDFVEDGNDYQIKASCAFLNGSYLSDTNGGITFDNSVPSTPSSVGPTGTVTNGTFTLRGTVADDNTTSCNFTFLNIIPGSGLKMRAGTYSTDSCTLSLTDVPEGTYNWLITASDELNFSNTSTQTTTVDIPSAGSRGAAMVLISQGQAQPGVSGTLTIGGLGREIGGLSIGMWLIILGVIGAIVYYIQKR